MKPLSLTTCLLCVLAIICLWLTLAVYNPNPRPTPVTERILAECWIGMQRLDNDGVNALVRQISNMTNSMDINHLFAVKLSGDRSTSNSLRFSRTEPLLILDGWGDPLNFAVNSNYSAGRILWLLRKTNSVAIWSSGPNGINDYGAGDDVVKLPR